MSSDAFADRASALENAFFAAHDSRVRREQEEDEAARADRHELSSACGIVDDAVLRLLIAQRVTGATIAALPFVPLVIVAWSDGTLHPDERIVLLAIAEESGLDRKALGFELLSRWLARRPPPDLEVAWSAYLKALSATLSVDARATMRLGLRKRMDAVAGAARGFMGLGRKVSVAEASAIFELDQAFC